MSEVSAAAQVLHLEGSWKGSLPAGFPGARPQDTVTSCPLPPAQVGPSPNLCRNPLQLVLAATLSFQEERDGPKTFPIPGSSDLRCLGAARPRLQPAARCAVPPLSPRALLPPAGHPAPSSGSRTAGEPREPLSPKAGLAERLCHQLWGGAGTTRGSCLQL